MTMRLRGVVRTHSDAYSCVEADSTKPHHSRGSPQTLSGAPYGTLRCHHEVSTQEFGVGWMQHTKIRPRPAQNSGVDIRQ